MIQNHQQHTLKEPLTLTIDISDQVEELSGLAYMAVNVYLPPDEFLQGRIPLSLFTLLHGGTYTRRYWDLVVPGYGGDEYSFAQYLAQRGHAVVTLDHLGMGESCCTLNGVELTTAMMAQAVVTVTNKVKEQLSNGTLVEGVEVAIPFSVLIGHSIGGHIAALVQAKWKTFNAVVIQGNCGIRKIFDADVLDERALQPVPNRNGYIDVPRPALHAFFHGAFSPPPQLVAEDDRYAVATPATLYLEVVQRPDIYIDWLRQIDVPMLLTYGESDVVIDQLGELNLLSASPSRSIYIQKGSAHCGNFAPTRSQLWQVLSQFAEWAQTICTDHAHP